MKKTGKSFLFLWMLAVLISFQNTVIAQDFEVSADLEPNKIFIGEQVRLTVTISGQLSSIQQPELPDIQGLEWLRNYTSRSSSYSIVNGRPTTQTGFIYTLVARTPGSFTIPPITISIEGTEYNTDVISFEVIDRNDLPQDSEDRAPDIYVELEPDTNEPVVGQQVVADIVLYFKDGIQVSSYQAAPGWKAEGFWKEELDNPQRVSTSSVIRNGIRYQRAKLLQYAIFPTKAGELTLSPFTITVSVRKARGQSLDIFSFGPNQERVELETEPVTINARTLPETDGFQFTGGVGKFSIKRTVSPKEALVGESIEVVTSITGQGNVPLINKPEYQYPENLEKYNPQENSSLTRADRQISGTKTFTDVLIARNEGQFSVPATVLAYYDPASQSFKKVTLEAVPLSIERDPDAVPSATNTIMRLDVEPITGLASWRQADSKSLHENIWIWISLIFPFLISSVAYAYKRHLNKMDTDTAYSRKVKAKEDALKILEEINGDDIKTGYHAIRKALVSYLTDKFDLPPAGSSSAELLSQLKSELKSEHHQELKKILDKCESIAYAPNTSMEDLKDDIEIATGLIKKMERSL